MKRIILLTAALCLMLTGCGSKEAEEPESTVLNVGILEGNDRYSYTDGGEILGIEANLAKETAVLLEKELKLNTVTAEEELFSGLQDGSFDLIFGRISENNEALKSFTASDRYGKSGIYLLTKKYDYTDSLTLPNTGMIGVSSSVESVADQVPGIGNFSVSGYTDMEKLSRDITSGTLAIGLCNEREAFAAVSDMLQTQEVLKGPYEYYVAAFKDNSDLKDAVNSAISAYYDRLAEEGGNGTTGETGGTEVFSPESGSAEAAGNPEVNGKEANQ